MAKTKRYADGIDSLADSIQENMKKQENTEWEKIRGSFIHIAFLTNTSRCEQAPFGLSKYGHLADGSIDLVLVNPISRKELYRFLKRHTNKKNQLGLPFVKCIRVKEARIKILNVSDSSETLNEDNLDMKNVERIDTARDTHRADDEEDESAYYRNKGLNTARRSPSERVQSIKPNKNFTGSGLFYIEKREKLNASVNSGYISNEDDEQEPNKIKLKKSNSNFGKNDETGFPRTLRNEAQNIESLFDHEASKYPGMLKNNFVNSASFKVASVWNCDWKFNRLPDMHIKCNRKFLPMFASGVDEDTDFEESASACFPGL